MGTMLDLVDRHCGMLHRVYFFKLSKINLAVSDLINYELNLISLV